MKFPKIILLAGMLSLTYACSDENLSDTSVVKIENEVADAEFDKWLQKNYADPYNINFNYRYVDKLYTHHSMLFLPM